MAPGPPGFTHIPTGCGRQAEIILDADAIISGERADFDLPRWLELRIDDHFAIAAITVAELWYGVERANEIHRKKRRIYIEALLAVLPILASTKPTAYRHARLWSSLDISGTSIGGYDLIVASTALHRGSALATFNEKHFARVKDLVVIEPE